MSKRVERHIIKPSHPNFAEVDAICLASKNLYNTIQFTVRQSFFYGHGVPTWGQLNEWFKDSGQLSRSALFVVDPALRVV